jgi:hypothetical protein
MGMYLTDLMTLDEVHKNTLEPGHPGTSPLLISLSLAPSC